MPARLDDSGGTGQFTAVVANTSTTDNVTLERLVDGQFLDVGDRCDRALPATLAPGDTLTCVYTGLILGIEGDTHTSVVTAAGTDDDGGWVTASGTTSITFTPAEPEPTGYPIYLPVITRNR